MQSGAEDTDDRALSLHTEMCEKGEVTSVEEGHDVERVIARSDVVKDTMSAMGKPAKEIDEPPLPSLPLPPLPLLPSRHWPAVCGLLVDGVAFQEKAGYRKVNSCPRTVQQKAPKSVSWRCTRCAVCEKDEGYGFERVTFDAGETW